MTTQTFADALDPAQNAGYFPQAIPSARDHQITAFLDSATASADLQGLMDGLSVKHSSMLLGYAERMASLAIRSSSVPILRHGLTAWAFAWRLSDSRDALTVLPLFVHSAGVVGASPDELFCSVGSMVGPEAQTVLQGFVQRPAHLKSLDAMGYVVGADEQGFRYRRTW